METMRKKNFKWRGVATFMLIMGITVVLVSGVVLYITPPGRYSHWTNWTLWGLSKDGWGAIHTIFGFLLLIIIAGHLYYNWRVIVAFFWSKARHTFNLKRELAVAAVVSLAVFVGTLWNLPPFSTVVNFGKQAKHSWEQNDPTYAHGRGRRFVSSSSEVSKGPGDRYTSSYRSSGQRASSEGWNRHRSPASSESALYSGRSGRKSSPGIAEEAKLRGMIQIGLGPRR